MYSQISYVCIYNIHVKTYVDMFMTFQYYGSWNTIECYPRKHVPLISDRQEMPGGKTTLRCPSASCMCEMAVASAILSSTSSTEAALNVTGG